MASFATDVKNEIARLPRGEECCERAELTALLRMGATITFGPGHTFGLEYQVENAAVARRTLVLLRELHRDLPAEVTVARNRRLRKKNSYAIAIPPSEGSTELLEEMGFLQNGSLNIESDAKVLRSSCCRAAYLRGAFLGGGSVNRPEADYHLELVTGSYSFGKMLRTLMRRLDFPVGFVDRKESYVVYLKEGDAVVDFLAMIGAEEAVESFEVARNVKEVREQVNRIVNCETANLQKAIDAAGRQLDDIRYLEERIGLDALPKREQEAAQVRLENPEANLAELAAIIHLSKPALAHRMRKLHDLAETVRQKEE